MPKDLPDREIADVVIGVLYEYDVRPTEDETERILEIVASHENLGVIASKARKLINRRADVQLNPGFDEDVIDYYYEILTGRS